MVVNYKPRFIPLKKDSVTYVVGVSGGPDSMFLLDKMRILKYHFIVVHVNYKKREDSDIDEFIVKKYCEKYKIVFFRKVVNYQNKSKKENFQAFARNFRYNLFSEICDSLSLDSSKLSAIVVAHNLEDSIETYYMQKKRRSIVSFWGLPFRSQWNNSEVNRPILGFSKDFIFRYLKKKNINYAIDYTNNQEVYLRNSIRKNIMPMALEKKVKLLAEISKYNNTLSKDLNIFSTNYFKVVLKDKIFLNSEWISFDSELKKRIVYAWINNFSSNSFLLRKKNTISELVKQFNSGSNYLVFNFKNGFKIKKHKSLVLISKENSN